MKNISTGTDQHKNASFAPKHGETANRQNALHNIDKSDEVDRASSRLNGKASAPRFRLIDDFLRQPFESPASKVIYYHTNLSYTVELCNRVISRIVGTTGEAPFMTRSIEYERVNGFHYLNNGQLSIWSASPEATPSSKIDGLVNSEKCIHTMHLTGKDFAFRHASREVIQAQGGRHETIAYPRRVELTNSPYR